MKSWQSRLLDAVYPIVYLDCIHTKVREGAVRVKDEAELRLGEFEAKWDDDFLPIGQSWRRKGASKNPALSRTQGVKR